MELRGKSHHLLWQEVSDVLHHKNIRRGHKFLHSPSTKWLTFFLQPPAGVFSLKGHRKLEAYLKLGPTDKICRDFTNQNRLHITCKIYKVRQEYGQKRLSLWYCSAEVASKVSHQQKLHNFTSLTSWIKSSTQMMPNLPREPSMRSLEVIGVRLPLIWMGNPLISWKKKLQICVIKILGVYQTVSGHYTNDGVGNVGYRKIHSRTAYSPAAQNE